MTTRQKALAALRENPHISVLVIGGGVNGIGTFRDLALQGVDVLLVEKGDFCSAASAANSHMVHGGLRYLENGEFRLVKEALRERNRLLRNAPHQVKPLRTMIPIYHWSSGILNAALKFLRLTSKPSNRGALIIKLGLTLYDLFTRGQQTLPRHKFRGRGASRKVRPQIHRRVVATATYYDAWMPCPERICLEMILDAEASSEAARALNYVRAESASGDTLLLHDEVNGESFAVKPQIVINATGAWIDFTNRDLGLQTKFIGGTKGSHLVVDHAELWEATQGEEIFFENRDGRIVLCFPIEDRVLMGTTDIPVDDPQAARIDEREIDYILSSIRHVFPEIRVKREDVVFQFTGVRPLPYSDAASPGQISRDHSIEMVEAGGGLAFPIMSLVGGKWTTFRAFSEQVADAVLQRLGRARQGATGDLAIGGGKDYPLSAGEQQQWLDAVESKSGVPTERLEILFGRYGTRAAAIAEAIAAGEDRALQSQSDYSRCEVEFLARNEKIVHLDDLVLRRSILALLGRLDGPTLSELAEVVGAALGWTDEQKRAEIERTIEILHEKHGVKRERLASTTRIAP